MSDRITFARSELVAALSIVGKVRPWQRDIKTLPLVRIDVADGSAMLTSANFDLSITTAITCSPGAATIFMPIDRLTEAAEKTVGDYIDFAPSGADTTISSGRFRARMSGSAIDAVAPRQVAGGDTITIACTALRAGLRAAAPASIDDEKQPFLGGVHLHDAGAGATFVAMDGNRIHAADGDGNRIHAADGDGNRIHAADGDGNRIHAAATLPDKLVDLLSSLLPDHGDAEILIGPRGCVVEFPGVRITSTIIEPKFPQYADQLAVTTDRVIFAQANELLADLELVAIVSSHRDRDIRLDLGETCEASAFRADEEGFQSGAVRLAVDFEGQPLVIGFQMGLVSDALSLFGREEIEWRMRGPHDPTVITSPARPGVRALVSPFMLVAEHLRKAA